MKTLMTIDELGKALNIDTKIITRLLGTDDFKKVTKTIRDKRVVAADKLEFIAALKPKSVRKKLGLLTSKNVFDLLPADLTKSTYDAFRKTLSDICLDNGIYFINVTEKVNSKRQTRRFTKISISEIEKILKSRQKQVEPVKVVEKTITPIVAVIPTVVAIPTVSENTDSRINALESLVKEQNSEIAKLISLVQSQQKPTVYSSDGSSDVTGPLIDLSNFPFGDVLIRLAKLRAEGKTDSTHLADDAFIKDMGARAATHGNNIYMSRSQKDLTIKIARKYPSILSDSEKQLINNTKTIYDPNF